MEAREIDLNKLLTEPFEVYRSNPAPGSGAIRELLKSPAHYRALSLSHKKETPALRLGKLVHAAILEPEMFRKNFLVEPEFIGMTKDGRPSNQSAEAKQKKAAWYSDIPPGAIIVEREEMDMIEGALNKALAHETLGPLLTQGVAERSIYFEWNGVKCKCRPDYLTQLGGEPCIVEIKTTGTGADWASFNRSINYYKYHVQAAYYIEGVKRLLGVDTVHYVWAAVEKESPWEIMVHEPTFSMIPKGREHCERALEIYKTCLEKNEWPGYDQKIQQHDDPAWLLWD